MKHILAVEDFADTRQWLCTLLAEVFADAQIQEAASLQQARAAIARQPPDLALLDISLPDGLGTALIADVLARNPQAYCVIATIHDDDTQLLGALAAGATGYLLKDQPEAELRLQLRGVLSGELPLSAAVAARVLAWAERGAAADPPPPALSEREREVLRLIARGYERAEVAEALQVPLNTVSAHVRGVYRKCRRPGAVPHAR